MTLRTRTLLIVTLMLVGISIVASLAGRLFPSLPSIVAIGIIATALGIVLSLWLVNSISNPVSKIIQSLKAIEDGEYRSSLLASLGDRRDEIGQLAHAVDELADEVAARDRRLKLLLRVIPAGVALSMESDFNRLLEAIVIESQSLTNADGGTLYMLEDKKLKFVILRNTSLNTAMGGTTGKAITFKPLPMYDEKTAQPNHHNVATHAALGHEWINIPDAYQADGFDFSGTRAFDKNTGYHSQSFLTIPLEGEEHQVIGVLQLLNAIDPDTGAVVPFKADEVFETLVLLASTALAGYIRQEKLRREIEKLNIEIDHAKKSRQVSEITESDYFQALLKKVRELRSKKKGQPR
jgi:HAMP domain-containing protein